MSPGQIPDRPPRRREQPKWPVILLIAGLTLTIAGLVLTVGPLALDFGNTDSPSIDESADDSADTDVDAGDNVGGTGDASVNGDEATGADDTEEPETTGISATIGTLFSGGDESADADDEEQEKCVVD